MGCFHGCRDFAENEIGLRAKTGFQATLLANRINNLASEKSDLGSASPKALTLACYPSKLHTPANADNCETEDSVLNVAMLAGLARI